MWKKIIISVVTIVLLLVAGGFWFVGLIEKGKITNEIKQRLPQDLVYFQGAVQQSRGKILAVVTSTNTIGSSGKKTGYELTELARAYYVFVANGFEVDISSSMGGNRLL